MEKFTIDQKKCLDYKHHQAVTANAGSGKTRILVERYLRIIYEEVINNRAKIEDIVAITFTKKAAAEMRMRIIKELNNEINRVEDNDKRYKLEHIRNNMIYARISTIHSFCGQLLKEYPIEAGVAYNYQDLDDYDRNILIEQSIDEIFGKIIDDDFASLDKRTFYMEIVAVFGYTSIREFIFNLLVSNENARLIYQFYEKSEEDIVNFYLDSFTAQLKNTLMQIQNIVEQSNKEASKEFKESEVMVYNEVLNINITDTTEFKDLIRLYIKLLKALHTKVGRSYLVSMITKSYPILSKHMKNLDKLFVGTPLSIDKLKKNELNNINNEIDNLEKLCIKYTSHVKKLVDLTQQINEHFSNLKLKLPALTFDDILLKTLELLQNNSHNVREKIRSKIKYLMVDEFQDTNQIQYEIIKNIVEDSQSNSYTAKTILFIVGDDKQSIYGFRSADVRVFNELKKNIEKHNKEHFKELEDNGIISLKESFRMLPSITGFINYILQNSMKSDISKFDVDYKEFVNGRVSLNNKELEHVGSIRILLSFITMDQGQDNSIAENTDIVESEDNESDNEQVEQAEIQNIADYINYIVQNENNQFDLIKGDAKVAPNYSDIAIIMRKRTQFPSLGNELLKRSIPYEISAGSGFFQTMEIIELTSALKFFADNNDIDLIGLLKSNMFNLKDIDILNISLMSNKENFWNKFVKYYEKDKNNFLIKRAYDIIIEFKELADKLPLDTFLSLLVERTSLLVAITDSHRAKQIKANINRFIDYVREFTAKGFRNISDLTQQINTLMASSSEPEAGVFSDENSVKILTIHASKGLEFPIVILADANYQDSNRVEIIEKDLGVNIKFAAPEDGITENVITTIAHNLIKINQNLANDAENLRLLYVALSRAKDHLIISASIKEGKNGFHQPRNFFKVILEQFESFKDADYNESLRTILDGNIMNISIVNNNFPIYYNGKQTDIELNLNIPIISKFYVQNIQNEVEEYTKKVIKDDVIQSFEINDVLSATKITSFFTDGLEYDYKYFFGFAPDSDSKIEMQFADTEKDEDQIAGSLAGSYIHHILQHILSWLPEVDNMDFKLLNSLIDNLEPIFSSKIDNGIKERIIKECTNVAQTKFIKSNYELIKKAKFEVTYSMPVNNDILLTTIDFLMIENNKVVICDWKTNKVNTPSDIASHYNLQMQVYAYIMSYLFPEQDEFQCKLLLTRLAKPNCNDSAWIYEFKFKREELVAFGNTIIEKAGFMKSPIEKNNNVNSTFLNN
ncbi:MAG TPA: UvrD-helicase domain-containing protein [Candidatus Kapabacteria bacterium]|nr:UvrD-helicase domain-containing protein [Candidatus Kapabacteria bacterium]